MSALLALLAGTFVATSIVVIGASSVLRGDGHPPEGARRSRRRF